MTHFKEVVEHEGRSTGAIGRKPFKITYISELEPVKRDNHHTLNKRNGTGTWTIQAGDTGNGISIRLSITFAQLMALNPTVQWQDLQIGQVVNIPCPDGGSGSTIYVIVAGDTGNSIAAAYGITFDQLSSYNPDVDWYDLQIGQTLLIPRPTTPIASPTISPDTSGSAQSTDLPAAASATLVVSDTMNNSAATSGSVLDDDGDDMPTASVTASEPSSSASMDPAITS